MNLRLRKLILLTVCFATLALARSFASAAAVAAPTDGGRLKVSDNRHFLVHDDGRPFFYLGDTAWELFHRLNREEADRYLQDRAGKGYTVIQAVALAELDGLAAPNAYGHRPLRDNDPAHPWTVDGAANDYWDHVDYIVRRANELGLTVGLLPTWGDKWNLAWGVGPVIFNPSNARTYGEWIGRRYRDAGIIWILGGDRNLETDTQKAVIVAMAEGIRAGDGGNHLITFHPQGGNGSSTWWHDAPWLDFNMRQNGHSADYAQYDKTRRDYERQPAKPVLDGEPIYEDHPVNFKAAEFGYSVAADVRRPLYWDLFNGACGHTYGNHALWQMAGGGRAPVNAPLMTWAEALDQPGAGQMQFARWLLESRPYLSRIPDASLIVEQTPATAWPGAGRYRFVGTRDAGGSFAMVYAPVGRKFKVRLSALGGEGVRAWWFNPRDGTAQLIGEFPKSAEREFITPTPGELLDWVLVLDDASQNFAAPGTRHSTGPLSGKPRT